MRRLTCLLLIASIAVLAPAAYASQPTGLVQPSLMRFGSVRTLAEELREAGLQLNWDAMTVTLDQQAKDGTIAWL